MCSLEFNDAKRPKDRAWREDKAARVPVFCRKDSLIDFGHDRPGRGGRPPILEN
jgi:hypothetical protein